ncbi:MAG TPA: hypothetical protein VFT66_18915 [Roseiflexaceae bacterium]|nr:hypothetical protein [Roseiflexaceae bacterium]
MLRRFDLSSEQMTWTLLGTGISLWCAVVAGSRLPQLALSAPFPLLGPVFWLGLALTIGAFFLGQGGQRLFAALVLGWYFVATIAFIYPYTVMHDSIANTLLFPGSESYQRAYSDSYNGFGTLVAWVERLSGIDPWTIARFFPVGMTLVYLLTLGLIMVTWRGRLLSSPLACALFALFFFAFGDAFYLRINAAPQTIGFVAFLITIGLLPLASHSLWLKGATLLALAAMIISHPVTPLLAVPGLVIVTASMGKTNATQIRRALELAGTFLVSYITWTLYRAEWILSRAAGTIMSAFTQEKSLPIVDTPLIYQVDTYMLLHRIFLIALLVVLAASYATLWRTRVWYIVTAWGIAFVPGFALLFSYHDFFDRILLFMLVPCALVFAEAGARLCRSLPKLKVPAAALVMALVLLSASISYFSIGVIDRVTQDEVEATQYLTTLHRPLRVYANGFNLPVSPDFTFVPASRGIIHYEELRGADAVIVSQQVEHAVLLVGRSPVSVAELVTFLHKDYEQVYANSGTRVFLKRSIARPGDSHGS